MTEFGVDLSEWLEAGRVRALLDLVDQLPSACRLYEAAANDPDEAESMAKARLEQSDEDSAEWSPRVSEFDLTAQMLRQVITELKLVKRAVVASGGGKPGKDKPFPAPRTAVDEALERLEDAVAADLMAQFGFDETDM